MFINELRGKSIVLWGTGQMAEEFILQWQYYSDVWKRISLLPFPSIRYVWDSNPEKQNKMFHEWEIEKPSLTNKIQEFYCIIAVDRCASIIRELEQANYYRDVDYKLWRYFFADLRSSMIDAIKEIIAGLSQKKIVGDIPDTMEIDASPETKISEVSLLYEEIEKSSLETHEKAVVEDIAIGSVLKTWIALRCPKKMFSEIEKHFPMSGIISGFAMLLDKKVDGIFAFFSESMLPNKKTEIIKTIGIFDLRYSNGGEQRVLSMLFPLYVSMGYRVIFFTDEQRSNKDYFTPDGVVRIVLSNHGLGRMKLRLEEFLHYIRAYHIDLICYHCIKQDISLFYEALYFRLLGIPVFAELHVMFLMFIQRRNYIKEIWIKTFQLMDRIVVLSRCNELFWNGMGCHAKYIPNPIGATQVLWNTPIPFAKRNGRSILWIGRTSNYGKRLLDVIDIMEKVRNAVPDAKLRIVGEVEGISGLVCLVRERGLEDSIEFCGYHTDVAPFYETSDIMLMTSEMEAFPMVLAESKLYGIPTVMYELPYLELVKDLQGVLPVKQKDKTAAAHAIISLLEDESFRHRMSVEAKKSILPFMEYDIAGAWKQVFEETLCTEAENNIGLEQRMVQQLLLRELWADETDI